MRMAMVKKQIKLIYPPELLDQPVLFNLIKHFDLVVNIRKANVNPEEGWLLLVVEGEEGTLKEGLTWLVGQGIQVESMEQS
jgi:hypothetical protein